MIYKFKKIIKKIAPSFLLDTYHFLWAFFSASVYGFPSRGIKVVSITGTKGKTTVAEIINAILNEAGLKTALVSSLRFKIGEKSWKNTLKMTMPGRGKIQRLLSEAVRDKCDWFILEATSEGIGQFRHKFIDFDAIIFTNLAPEHIESHGSFEKYKEAKGRLFETKSRKKKIHIININDQNAAYFLNFEADRKMGYGINQQPEIDSQQQSIEKFQVSSFKFKEEGIDFEINGNRFHSSLVGEFNLYNILAAIAFARSQNIDWNIICAAVLKFKSIPGRMQFIKAGQPFNVVIDYAHTPDSLEKIYQTLRNSKFEARNLKFQSRTLDSLQGRQIQNPNDQNSKLICLLGSAGGGRDKWKRPEMGKIAADYCDEIILTNEDPYDENPSQILLEIKSGIFNFQFSISNLYEIIDRREAIKKAFDLAKAGDTVVLTGKGSELWMIEKNGKKIPWNEEAIVRECLRNVK